LIRDCLLLFCSLLSSDTKGLKSFHFLFSCKSDSYELLLELSSLLKSLLVLV